MDITKLKKYVSKNTITIIVAILIVISFIGFHYYVISYDTNLALSYINMDLLERSIDEEYYIINRELVFDEEKLKDNIDYLFTNNKLNVKYSVKVIENKALIKIGNIEKEYEITKNIN